MENIVLGLFKSQHNIKLKKAFIDKLIDSNQLPSQNFQLIQFLNELKSQFSIGLNNSLNLDLSIPLIAQIEQSNRAYETLRDHYDLIYVVLKYLLDYVNNVKSNENTKTYNDLVVDLINLAKLTFLPNLSSLNNRSCFLIKNDLIILFIWSRLISESILSTTNNHELRFNLLNYLLILNQNLLNNQHKVTAQSTNNIQNSTNYLYFMQTDSNFCSNYLRLIRTILVNLVDDYTTKQSDENINQSASVLIEKSLVEVITLLMISVIKEQPIVSNLDEQKENLKHKLDLKENLKNLKDIVDLISYFIQKSDKLFEVTLKFLIEMLSTTAKSTEPNKYLFNGGAIAELFKCFEFTKAKLVIEDFFRNPNQNNVDDESIKTFLNNLITLLCWPFENNIDQWIITLMTYLAVISKKFQLLIALCEENVDLVLRFIQNKNSSKASLNVLSFFLLNYKHSPKLFHRSCPKLVKLLEKYKEEEDKSVYNHLTVLTFACMYNFGGYPTVYKPLIDVIKNDFDLSNFDSFVSKYIIDKNMQNIQFNMSQANQQEDDLIDMSNIDESNIEMMNKKLRKNVTGLINLGNTCYLNSMIQSLYSCKKFLKCILEMQLEKQNDTSFLGQLQILFSLMHFSERKAVRPNNFVKFCTPSWFRLGQQQDSSEFLIFLLDNLQEQIKTLCHDNPKMSIYSNMITKLFGIQLTTEIICKKCSTKTNRSDVSFYLPLSFHESTPATTTTCNSEQKSLQTLIDNFFHEELLSSETDNSYQCSKCESLQSATKQILFTRDDSKNIQPPEYLILTLNRFIYNYSNNGPDATPTNKKIMDKLDYPSRLTIKTIFNEKIINETYELNSIVIHSGSSLHYGHYYSYITNKLVINENDITGEKMEMETNQQSDNNKKDDYLMEWLLANDSQINTSTYDGLISNLNLFKDDTPYVLFYRRVLDTDNDESTEIDNENIKNKNLINFIEQDNKIYVVEEKNRIMNMIKMKKQSKNAANSSIHSKNSYSSREDDDDVGGGSSSGQPDNYCSSDSQRDSGPRIIF